MQAVVFDFDGVIVDSEHLHDQALREVCHPLGFEWSGDAWVGWSDAEVFIELHRRRGESLSPTALRELLEHKTQVVLKQIDSGLYRAYPGSAELIREVSLEVPVAVCSAGMRSQIEPVLRQLGLAPLVTTIVAFEDTPRSKPDPAPYLLAAKRLEIDPARSIAIEDSPRGVASAHAAGYRVIAVGHTSPREKLAAAHRFVAGTIQLNLASLRELVEMAH